LKHCIIEGCVKIIIDYLLILLANIINDIIIEMMIDILKIDNNVCNVWLWKWNDILAYNDIDYDDIIIKILWPTMISVIQYY